MASSAHGISTQDNYMMDNSYAFNRFERPYAQERADFMSAAIRQQFSKPDTSIGDKAKTYVKDLVHTVNNPTSAYTKKSSSPGSSSDPFESSAADPDITNQFQSLIDTMYQFNEQNNARMEEAAERQMRFQDQSQAKTMQFNAEQARLDRDWQEYMSSTAHQRETADLIAAGLNPVLSANGGAPIGSGASASAAAQSGSKADVDTSISNFLGNLAGAMASMHNAEVSAKATMGAASINASALQAAAKLGMFGSFGSAGLGMLGNILSTILRGKK